MCTQAYEFRGKSPQELTQDDLDELAYQKGEYLAQIQQYQDTINGSDAQLELTRIKNKKKNRLGDYRQTVKDMKAEKQNIIDAALVPYREQLAQLDDEITGMQEIIVTFTDNMDDAITNLGITLAEVEGRIENYEEQVELIELIVLQAKRARQDKKMKNPVVKLTAAQVKVLQSLREVDKKRYPGTLNAYAFNWNTLEALGKRGLIILKTPANDPNRQYPEELSKQAFRNYSYATITEEGREIIKEVQNIKGVNNV